MKNKEERYYPTQKPIKVMREIIEMFSKEGELILDPFCGVGSTCIACNQLNRRFIGTELNKKYFDIANKRLSQGTLFNVMQPLDVKQEGGNGLPPTDKSMGIRPTIL